MVAMQFNSYATNPPSLFLVKQKNSSFKANYNLINRGVVRFSNPGGGSGRGGGGLKPVVMCTVYELYCRLPQIFAGIWEDSADFTQFICNTGVL